jgi:hypothetical protein
MGNGTMALVPDLPAFPLSAPLGPITGQDPTHDLPKLCLKGVRKQLCSPANQRLKDGTLVPGNKFFMTRGARYTGIALIPSTDIPFGVNISNTRGSTQTPVSTTVSSGQRDFLALVRTMDVARG